MDRRTTIVTTSWDDGDFADLKLAKILSSKGIRGTFYIPIQYRNCSPDPNELRSLASAGFEIGAHGFSHVPLCGLPPEALARDVRCCKEILEDILGKQVQMFCYPRGRYDSAVVRALRQAGYRGARTVQMLRTRTTFDPFEMPTSLQAYPHTPLTYFKNVARTPSVQGMQSLLAHVSRVSSWLELGKRLFDAALENGGVWHLFGHSWEIEELGLWNDLREILDYVSRRDGVSYVPNCAFLRPHPSSAGSICGDVVPAIPAVRKVDPPFHELQG